MYNYGERSNNEDRLKFQNEQRNPNSRNKALYPLSYSNLSVKRNGKKNQKNGNITF